ncbi:hypothetical protein GCM10011588_60510 [Nocardia jinanensis]|uniref:Uncharacterized protein n=2 Tax=Nocardia jinanensis TaxID=382504 RepID=A0A917RWQ1_9NOCA|nr:hypothetical protein GCM10011588_60510 [Nocardia jinanensis]
MAATLKLLQAGKTWVTDDPRILRQIADGLRTLDHHATHCRSQAPIRGYAHAHQIMATHAAHHCPRFDAAAEYAAQARP